MTAEGEMTKAMLVALALGIPVCAALIASGAIDPYVAIPARFWLGSALGVYAYYVQDLPEPGQIITVEEEEIALLTDRLGRAVDRVLETEPIALNEDERERQHSLFATPVHLTWEGHRIHLVDAPGAIDFVGEAITALAPVEIAAICVNAHDGIGVSTPELERMIALARQSGAAGAKLTGAGGGGSIVALCPGTVDEVAGALRRSGYNTLVPGGVNRS